MIMRVMQVGCVEMIMLFRLMVVRVGMGLFPVGRARWMIVLMMVIIMTVAVLVGQIAVMVVMAVVFTHQQISPHQHH